MSKQQIQQLFTENKDLLQKKYKVKKIGVFGSYARGEETDESDIDVLVEFSEPIGLDYFDLKYFLEEQFDKQVDLVTLKGLHWFIKDDVLKEAEFTINL